MKFKFDCGCEIDILDDQLKECDGLPSMKIDYYNINMECQDTWDLIGSGRTKGVFQLESNLGQSWAEKFKPNNMEEMSALLSLIRPGGLYAISDGKNMPQHYADRKHGLEEAKYFHESLEPILKDTYNIITYQEQLMRISTDIAGFSSTEADTLRKSVGKKDVKLMASLKESFINGCVKVGKINQEQAETIFGWIQESQRYLFVKAHACGYGTTGYWSAYVKHHFPLHFYTSWLHYADEKMNPQSEIQELITDGKNFNIEIKPPSFPLIKQSSTFTLTQHGIYFGIKDIKGIGSKQIENIINLVNTLEKKISKNIQDWTWYEFLTQYIPHSNKTVINGLIASGTLSYFKLSREKMTFEFNQWNKLTNTEQEFITNNYSKAASLKDILIYTIENKPRTNVNRKETIKALIESLIDPPYEITDNPRIISQQEKELLGVSISYCSTDEYNHLGDTTCQEFKDGKTGDMVILAEVTTIKEWTTKTGQKMCFLSITDSTGTLNSVVAFADVWKSSKQHLYLGNILLFVGKKNYRNGQISFVISKVLVV